MISSTAIEYECIHTVNVFIKYMYMCQCISDRKIILTKSVIAFFILQNSHFNENFISYMLACVLGTYT